MWNRENSRAHAADEHSYNNSSKFGTGAQTAAPGSRSTHLDPPDPGIGIAASASMPLGMSGSIGGVGRSASSASSAAAEAASSSPAATAAATVTWARGVRVRGTGHGAGRRRRLRRQGGGQVPPSSGQERTCPFLVTPSMRFVAFWPLKKGLYGGLHFTLALLLLSA